MPKSTLQILKDAKQVLIDKGWHQGSWGKRIDDAERLEPSNCSGFCALGAIAYAAGTEFGASSWHPASNVLRTALLQRVAAANGNLPQHVTLYNDSDERKLEDILSLYDDAIAIATQAERVANEFRS